MVVYKGDLSPHGALKVNDNAHLWTVARRRLETIGVYLMRRLSHRLDRLHVTALIFHNNLLFYHEKERFLGVASGANMYFPWPKEDPRGDAMAMLQHRIVVSEHRDACEERAAEENLRIHNSPR